MVPEKYVRMIQEMYRNAVTRVRSSVGETDGFKVKVGQHQGSALNSFIFNIVMDVVTRNVRETVSLSIFIYKGSIKMDRDELKRVQKFKYLGSIVDASGNMDEVKHRVQTGWNKWRSSSGVFCDKKVPL
ncbi:uncharacterized protein [Penaeus vannamei]|uniref:uncharacterized protein n=1 Tax=Penaeus vannamei TaxID=6689 RepID=UPI00387F47DB